MRVLTIVAVTATAILSLTSGLRAQSTRALEAELRTAQYNERIRGDVRSAQAVYQRLARSSDRALAAEALLALAESLDRIRQGDAPGTLRRIVTDYSGTRAAEIARARIATLEQRTGGPTQRALVTGPAGNEAWSHVSPDGRSLAFQHPETGNVAVRDLNSGQTRVLTSSLAEKEGPTEFSVWSPDSRRLAYSCWIPNSGKPDVMELRVIGRDGGPSQTIFKSGSNWLQPLAWSPDGRAIVIVRAISAATNELTLVAVADGRPRVLKTDVRPTSATFSPDGRFVAYDYAASRTVPMREINVIGADGANDRPLVASPDDDFLLGWAPDGRHVIFGSDRRGAPGAWALPVTNGVPAGDPVLVKADIGRSQSLGFDSKGRLYTATSVGGMDVFVAELDPETGKMTRQAAPLGKAQPHARRNQGTWSPDGQRIVYTQSSEGRGVTIVVQTMATSEVKAVPTTLLNIGRPSWFRDGSAIAVEATTTEGQRGIFKVALDSGAFTTLVQPGPNFWGISPDGQHLLFGRPDNGQPTLWRRRITDGSEEKVRSTGSGSISVLSPDGRSVAARVGGRGRPVTIITLPFDGGPDRVVLDGVPDSSANVLAWSADGQHLFYIAHWNQLWRVPVAGGVPIDTGIRIEIAKHISVNPDGRRVALSGGIVEMEVWLWENLQPRR